MVTIATDTGDSEADKQRRYVVVALVQDNAVPPNRSATSFAYTRDSEGPEVSLSKSQSDIGNIGTETVTVGVGGTISDNNVIKVADLSIRMVAADAGADACEAAEDLSQGRTGRVVRNRRDLENDSNKIEFDETFTIRRPTGEGVGPETYCFWLASADVAVEADGRGDGNSGDYELGRFSVGWPEGPAPPPPGPTFEFTNVDGTEIDEALAVTEGAADVGRRCDDVLRQAGEYDRDCSDRHAHRVQRIHRGSVDLTFPNADGTSDTLNVLVTAAHDLDITPDRWHGYALGDGLRGCDASGDVE